MILVVQTIMAVVYGSDDNDGLNDNGDDDSYKEDFDNNETYTEDDDRGFSDDDVPIEQFTAPDFDEFDFESDDEDRKSTRLNSSHLVISYAVFCLKKKTKTKTTWQNL